MHEISDELNGFLEYSGKHSFAREMGRIKLLEM